MRERETDRVREENIIHPYIKMSHSVTHALGRQNVPHRKNPCTGREGWGKNSHSFHKSRRRHNLKNNKTKPELNLFDRRDHNSLTPLEPTVRGKT